VEIDARRVAESGIFCLRPLTVQDAFRIKRRNVRRQTILACATPYTMPLALGSLAALALLPMAALLPHEVARAQQAQTVDEPAAKPDTKSDAKSDIERAYIAADAAYKALARRNNAAALAEAREAVRLAPRNRDYRLLLINALEVTRNLREAETNLSALLAQSPEPDLFAQRAYLRLRRGNKAGAALDFAAAARAFDASSEKGRALRLVQSDAALASGSPQQALNALAPYANERRYDIVSRRGFALLALKRYKEALNAFTLGVAHAGTAAERATMIRAQVGVLVDLGRKQEAKTRFAQALRAGRLKGTGNLDIAYLAARVGDDATALDFFRQARRRGELTGAAAFDAGYVAKRLAQNAEAIAFFKMGIDADETAPARRDPQYIFGVRREVAELERVWGATVSLSYGGVGVSPAGPGATPPSGGSVGQVGGEVFWRPPVIGNRNGALVELFGRAFETLYDETGGATGAETIQGTAGARWKPLSDFNFVVEGGRMFKVGSLSRNDWLLRTAFSDGGGTDLRADKPYWFTWQVYAEYDRFFETAQNVALFEGRVGESFLLDKVGGRLVLTPHLAVIARYDSTLATPRTFGAGPGVVLRYWFNEDKYAAPRSYIEAVVQYRARISGDDRIKGLFAGINLVY
jgi:tetratricopeptide (TPR) repeat protein